MNEPPSDASALPVASVKEGPEPVFEVDPDPDARRVTVFVLGVAATMVFVALRFVVALGGHEPLDLDRWWNDLMIATLSEPAIIVAWVPGIVGGTLGMIIVGMVLVALFVWRRRPSDAAVLAVAMITVVAVGAPMAAVIARVRPADSLAESVPTSFPSGHTAVATTVVVILGLLLRRWYVWVIGVAWVVLMMWSRTYLHAHWISDVLAGMFEGLAVACLVWCVLEAIRDHRAVRVIRVPSHSERED